jgi:hypothetical protein
MSCICTKGDPCDYHAATCLNCVGGCKGHPEPTREETAKKAREALNSKVDMTLPPY